MKKMNKPQQKSYPFYAQTNHHPQTEKSHNNLNTSMNLTNKIKLKSEKNSLNTSFGNFSSKKNRESWYLIII